MLDRVATEIKNNLREPVGISKKLFWEFPFEGAPECELFLLCLDFQKAGERISPRPIAALGSILPGWGGLGVISCVTKS